MPDSIALVAMPWALLEFPSIPLGILNGSLRAAGIAPVMRCYNLAFVDFLGEQGFTPRDYQELAHLSPSLGLADWVFSLPPFRPPSPDEDEAYLRRLIARSSVPAELVDRARAMRAAMPAFIDRCAADLAGLHPAMVGFTTTFSQNVSSLLLARVLKERVPSVAVVFGGANCDGAMGQAMFDAFPWVDAVVQGEGERVVVDLARDALAGRIRSRPGVLARGSSRLPLVRSVPRVAMDDIPTPDYDFYFEALESSRFGDEIRAAVQIPVETARGCWWGEKQHCTFCGLNGSNMAFRSKSVERALRDFTELAARHRCLDFCAVDNIIDLDYLRELLPRLKETGIDFRIFYETKSNLGKEQVRAMWESGIRRIQPGIESLSTPILRLMRKGVSAWRNVQLLKWAMQFGLHVDWNVLYGFPGEPAAEYARMSELVPSLTHLQPPNFVRMLVQRFSPYHQQPGEFGIRLDGPTEHYRMVYPAGVRLDDLAYYFDFSYLDGRDPDDYVGGLRDAIAAWSRLHERNRGALSYRHGPGFVRIVDNREPFGYTSYVLEGEQAAAYLACDGGTTLAAVCRALARQGYTVLPGEVEEFLRELVEARLMFESDGHFVSLALPAFPERDAARAQERRVSSDAAA